MKMWIQIKEHDEDDQYSDDATYEVLTSGVLKVTSGNDIHLYSPAYWQEVTIDTRSADQRDKQVPQLDEDSNGSDGRGAVSAGEGEFGDRIEGNDFRSDTCVLRVLPVRGRAHPLGIARIELIRQGTSVFGTSVEQRVRVPLAQFDRGPG